MTTRAAALLGTAVIVAAMALAAGYALGQYLVGSRQVEMQIDFAEKQSHRARTIFEQSLKS